ncbi:MAG: isochorismatase family cysteine hydrolase [Clostridia bacterium]|nr:isochorismatase family cysteine hydrolase [Clostridia bacterium]
MKYLIVVDMQKDFIDGALGTPEAVAILPSVVEKIKGFSGKVLCTRDTHHENYLQTQEGKKLPVPHCIEGSEGWQLYPEIAPLVTEPPIDKPTFGSAALGARLASENAVAPIESITLIGLCTDICVISNALLLKAFLPETRIVVDAACCAGVTAQSHQTALDAMRACQIEIENA